MSGGIVDKKVISIVLALCTLVIVGVLVVAYGTGKLVGWATSGAITPSVGVVSFSYSAFLVAFAVSRSSQGRPNGTFSLRQRMVNICALSLLVVVYSCWLLPDGRVVWIVYGISLVLLVQIGSHGFAVARNAVLGRIMRWQQREQDRKGRAEFARYFEQNSMAYIALPLGSAMGVGWSAIAKIGDPNSIVKLSVACILGCIAIALIGSLVRGVVVLVITFLEVAASKKTIDVSIDKARIVVRVPNPNGERAQFERALSDGAVIAMDIRRIYFLNQLQLLAVLVPVAFGCLGLLDVFVHWKIWWVILIAAIVITSQVPFVIGQFRSHLLLLGDRRGIDRAELWEAIRKHSPLFPGSQSWLAMTGSGTFGAIALKLIDDLI